MEFDILSPEFMELAEKAKDIYNQKEHELKTFKDLYVQHKQKITDLDKQASQLQETYAEVMKSKQVRK